MLRCQYNLEKHLGEHFRVWPRPLIAPRLMADNYGGFEKFDMARARALTLRDGAVDSEPRILECLIRSGCGRVPDLTVAYRRPIAKRSSSRIAARSSCLRTGRDRCAPLITRPVPKGHPADFHDTMIRR